jgi:hypothetical protein
MTRQLRAIPQPILEEPRPLKSVPALGQPLRPGMTSLLPLAQPAMGLLPVMVQVLGRPLRPGPMVLPTMVELSKTALLRGVALLCVLTLILPVPLRLGMSLLEMASLLRRALLRGTVSLPQLMFRPEEARHHQGWSSPECRMTPAEYQAQRAISKDA